MLIPDDLYYTESHEWVRINGDEAVIGITDFAQHELGDIVYVELPDDGKRVAAGEPCGSIEAVKAVEDIISPLSGRVENRNTDLEDASDLINKSPYEDGWLIKIKLSNKDEIENLLSAADYKRIVEQ